jgi:predicted ABC-class ATPase
MEMGSNLLLVDEDTCATNFMIRDDKMVQLVAADKEPITPFVRKVRSMHEEHGISSILVIGGSGDYFDVADTVVMMDCYKCLDVTARAKEIAGPPMSIPFGNVKQRYPNCALFKADGKVAVRSETTISYGDIEVDTGALEQVVAKSQTAAISQAFQTIASLSAGGGSMKETLNRLDQRVDQEGLNFLAPGLYHGGLSRARGIDIAAAMNRFRKPGVITQR